MESFSTAHFASAAFFKSLLTASQPFDVLPPKNPIVKPNNPENSSDWEKSVRLGSDGSAVKSKSCFPVKMYGIDPSQLNWAGVLF